MTKKKTISVVSTSAAKLCNTILYRRLGSGFSDGVQAFGIFQGGARVG